MSLASCGGDAANENADQDSTKVSVIDTLENNTAVNLDSLFGNQFEVKANLPYKIDSIFFENVDITQKQLTSDQTIFLSTNLMESEFSYAAKSNIDDVLFFDSRKVNDGHQEYIEIGPWYDERCHSTCDL